MRVRGVKARVRQHGGEVTDVGYVTVGRAKEAHVEAYFGADSGESASSSAESAASADEEEGDDVPRGE